MNRLYAIEPWRLALMGGFVALAYAVVPNIATSGSGGSWMPLLSALFAVDRLAGQRLGDPAFGGLTWVGWTVGLGALELGVLVPGVDPQVTALYAAAIALLALLVFARAARAVRLLSGSTPRVCAGVCWAIASLIVPPAAALATGMTRNLLCLGWAIIGIAPVILIFRRLSALDRPVPPAASL